MRYLGLPAIDSAETFILTLSKMHKGSDLRRRLEAARPEIDAASVRYLEAAEAGSLSSEPDFVLSEVTEDEMATHYDSRFASSKGPGREIYDRIKTRARGTCPMCGHRTVSTLDHYWPKRPHSGLAVNPCNLVPCCADCNHLKGSFLPASRSEELLHPYFDAVDNDIWLQADIASEHGGAVFVFRVDAPVAWPPVKRDRVRHHFERLGLAELYSLQAATELESIRVELEEVRGDSGADGVAKHLERGARSRSAVALNGWQAAMYRAMAASRDFCSGALG